MLDVERDGFKLSKCKFCGLDIVWADNAAGGRIPLDPKAPVFGAQSGQPAVQVKYLSALNRERLLVSHFSTCPAKQRAWTSLGYIEEILKGWKTTILEDGSFTMNREDLERLADLARRRGGGK